MTNLRQRINMPISMKVANQSLRRTSQMDARKRILRKAGKECHLTMTLYRH